MSVAAPEPVLARDFGLDINTGTPSVPVWTAIGGITGITPGQSSQTTDDTDFDNAGHEAGTTVQRGRTLSVALNYKQNGDGDRDPGQEALLAIGDAIGTTAKGHFRHSWPEGGGYTFRATVDVAWPGGDKTSNATCTAELKLDGAPTPVA